VQNEKVTRRVLCDISYGRSRRVDFSPGVYQGHQVQNEKVTQRVSFDISNERSRGAKFSPGVVRGHQVQNEKLLKGYHVIYQMEGVEEKSLALRCSRVIECKN
jgi:hypothetical protein